MAFSEASHYRTVEALGLGIIQHIFQSFNEVNLVTVKVEKPKALLQAKSAGVELTRRRVQGEDKSPDSPNFLYPSNPVVSMVRSSDHQDVIFVNQLEAFVILGVNPWEREEKQRITIDLVIYPEGSFEDLGDHVKRQHNYRTISRMVLDLVEVSRFKTVEALVSSITNVCINTCHVKKIKVRVDKPSALIFADSASIEVVREKDETKNVNTLENKAMSDWHVSYIAFGSNVGDRAANISKAIDLLNENSECKVVDTSFLYETTPMYVTNQDTFINGCLKLLTKLEPLNLLKLLKDIEKKVGRIERERNGPREVDLDILLYDNVEMDETELKIPHPLMKERLFVLQPLCDIAPFVEHPSFHRPCSHLLKMKLESLRDVSKDKKEVVKKVTPLKNGNFVQWGNRTLVMGIINVTPDSFSGDGAQFYVSPENQRAADASYDFNRMPSHVNVPPLPAADKDRIIKHIKELAANGCDIIDIGGYSTRPNAAEVSVEEELRRVLPIIRCVVDSGVNIPISIDTFRAKVAEEAVKCGASMINDVSGGNLDNKMLSTMSELDVPVCLMHMRGTPETMTTLTDYSMPSTDLGRLHVIAGSAYDDESLPEHLSQDDLNVIRGVKQELSLSVMNGLLSGIKRWNIIMDPGIGFAKNAQQSIALLKHFDLLLKECTDFVFSSKSDNNNELPYWNNLAGFPSLIGASRKSFIGKVTNKPDAKGRLFGTASVISASVSAGSSIVRVHDVKEMVDVVKMSDAIFRK